MKEQKPCKYCGRTDHYSIACFNKPRGRIKPKSDKYYQQEMDTKWQWFKLNPPDENGYWNCYLSISPMCPIRLNRDTLRLEHVKPRARYPELKFDVTNLKPACSWCNMIKGSSELEELVEDYPHLKVYI